MTTEEKYKDTIRILHIDDQFDFAEMTTTFLERENDRFNTEIATSANDGLARLAGSTFDCIISDYDMPQMDGIDFLETVREEYPDLPFILYTGKGSETIASEAISAGVTEYLQKSSGNEQYELLAHRIVNAVDQSQAERRVQQEQQRFQTLFDRLSQPIVEVQYESDEPIVTYVNLAFEDVFGYEANTLVGDSLDAHIVPDDRVDEAEAINQYVQAGGRLKSRRVTRETVDGLREFLIQNAVYDDGSGGFAIYTDITDRTERKETLKRNQDLLRHTEQLADVGGWEADMETGEARWTQGTYAIHDIDPDDEFELSLETGIEFCHPDDQAKIETAISNCHAHGEPFEIELRLITAENEQKWVRATGEPVYDSDDVTKIRGAIRDITQQHERRQRLEQIETFFEHTQDSRFLISVGEEFVIERVNQSWEDASGVSAEESCGQTIQDVLDESQVKKVEQKYRNCVEQRETLEYEERLQIGDDPVHWQTRITPVVIDGEVEYIAGVTRDITDIKHRKQELAELNQKYQTLAKNFPDGAVYLINENFEYVYARGEALERADLSPSDIEGHVPHDVFPDELADEACHQYEQAFDGIATTAEQEYNGDRYRARVTPVESDSKEITHVMAVAQDITEFAEDRKQLKRQNKRLDEFASVVSHDLRNPLSVAEGNVELLREDCNCNNKRIDRIDSALTRMDDLIENLLTLARADEQINGTESVNLAELSQNCRQNVETTDADATVNIDITATQSIEADPNRLAQLLENLMRNAIEHTNEDVAVTIGELEDGFYVEDDGSGVPADKRDDVFEAGYTTTNQGTGFGLSIVKQVVEAHGWEMSLTEGSEGGARFEVTQVDGLKPST
ncbi:hybrid sensor histidine kinase/response regulator [Haloquadratum walsbyi]|uniref:histidine kinase n=1 Tax=Haloquadratum walsbyi (strain DSM 16854 / JCM 12705 / C23) TaxID=768065 RepID=G0LN81_HALWC|nr:PAS domain-containing protein [Haloquadratum walsbyi]CCC41887.1 receiver/sensor box histidine kinase [Haloquadratum walsbyi C23]